MNHDMLKSFKIGFWFLIPLFFITNSDLEPIAKAKKTQDVLAMRANGAFQELLDGRVTFETSKGIADEGTPYASISLKFESEEQNQEQLMGFYIKKQDNSKEFTIGEYELSKHIKGFLNNFDGVFGYADIESLGDKPLFAKKGKLVITQIDADNIRGYLNVRFNDNDNNGNALFVKGNFHAVSYSGKWYKVSMNRGLSYKLCIFKHNYD